MSTTAADLAAAPAAGSTPADLPPSAPPDPNQLETHVPPPDAPVGTGVRIDAKSALGLDAAPGETIDDLRKSLESRNASKEIVPRDPATGRFLRPGEKPSTPPPAPAKPAAAKPATPPPAPAPATPPTPPAKPAEEPPKTVTIKGKQYSIADLEKMLEKPTPPPAQPAAPAAPAQPAAPAGPTQEDIIKAENNFVAAMAEKVAVDITDADLEKILVGGPEGVKAVSSLLKTTAARAILEARRSMYDDLNPVFDKVTQQISGLMPLQQQQHEIERVATEAAFRQQFPEYGPSQLETARLVAEELLARHGDTVRNWTREQFLTEVERQSNALLEQEFVRWNPGKTDWKAAVRAAQAAAPATPPATPPAPAPAAAPATPPAAPARPRPPAGNSPNAAVPVSGGLPSGSRDHDWHKKTAASLV